MATVCVRCSGPLQPVRLFRGYQKCCHCAIRERMRRAEDGARFDPCIYCAGHSHQWEACPEIPSERVAAKIMRVLHAFGPARVMADPAFFRHHYWPCANSDVVFGKPLS